MGITAVCDWLEQCSLSDANLIHVYCHHGNVPTVPVTCSTDWETSTVNKHYEMLACTYNSIPKVEQLTNKLIQGTKAPEQYITH